MVLRTYMFCNKQVSTSKIKYSSEIQLRFHGEKVFGDNNNLWKYNHNLKLYHYLCHQVDSTSSFSPLVHVQFLRRANLISVSGAESSLESFIFLGQK